MHGFLRTILGLFRSWWEWIGYLTFFVFSIGKIGEENWTVDKTSAVLVIGFAVTLVIQNIRFRWQMRTLIKILSGNDGHFVLEGRWWRIGLLNKSRIEALKNVTVMLWTMKDHNGKDVLPVLPSELRLQGDREPYKRSFAMNRKQKVYIDVFSKAEVALGPPNKYGESSETEMRLFFQFVDERFCQIPVPYPEKYLELELNITGANTNEINTKFVITIENGKPTLKPAQKSKKFWARAS